MTTPILLAPSAMLARLAERVQRLVPSRFDPEAYHVERDDVARTLRRMALDAAERGQ